tara:strand:- start:1602 stop:2648 length:1047 start_codon:yes stop_codon:yes gene_type:complete
MKNVLITGSGGLIGSEAVKFYTSKGFQVYGIDNNMRSYFFGSKASVKWNIDDITRKCSLYKHYYLDIRNRKEINSLFTALKFDLIIHAAAQPSHDWAANEPITDFSINTEGTINLLEAFRNSCPEAVFIYLSTNKVYGDSPNKLPLIELDKRFEIEINHNYKNGISEEMKIDQSKHSLFGCSKLAADIYVQEYGKYFNLKTGVFRGGCLTGPAHSASRLHGFIAYLVKCIHKGDLYTINGYKGKQVRDNIHSYDLITALNCFYEKPKYGEVYNIGGSRHSNTSILEAIDRIEEILGKKANYKYSDKNRSGDHIWYISDISKFKKHYPDWEYKYNQEDILESICQTLVK